METLIFPAGVAWTTGVGLRGTPGWGVGRPRRGQTPHSGGSWLLPRGRPRRGVTVRAFPVERASPAGVAPRREAFPRVTNFFPNGVVPFLHPGRPGTENLSLTRGVTPRGRWAYLLGRGGKNISPRWLRTAPPVNSVVHRGGAYQMNYLGGLAGFFRTNPGTPPGGATGDPPPGDQASSPGGPETTPAG